MSLVRTSSRPVSVSRRNVSAAIALALFTAATEGVQAQKRPMFDAEGDLLLSAQVIATSTIVRPHHPTPVQVPLIWRGKRLLQGRLHYRFYLYDPDDPVLTMISPELTLDAVPRELNFMLPAIGGIAHRTDTLFAHLSFAEDGNPERFDLETHSLRLGMGPDATPFNVANYCIAVVHPRFGDNFVSDGSERTWWSDFQPGIHSTESFERGLAAPSRGTRRHAVDLAPVTYPAFMPPDRLPESVLALTGYDAVFLQEGIGGLSDRQRTALAGWVNAGGRIVVRREAEAGAAAAVDAFLRQCGCRVRPGHPTPQPEALRSNLGQVLVVPETYIASKVPAATMPEPTARGNERTRRSGPPGEGARPLPEAFYDNVHAGAVHRFWSAPLTTPAALSAESAEWLAPTGLQTLPVNAILACIGLFLLAAAPLDYFYLGMLRRRNLTWIIYPVAALACSWLVVKATNSRITGDANGSWDIIVLGHDNTPLRRETLQLLLNRRHSTIDVVGKRMLYAIDGLPRHGESPVRRDEEAQVEGWTITGSYPDSYRGSARLAQWTPVVEKSTRYFPALDVPDLPWHEMDPWPFIRDPGTRDPDRQSHASRVIAAAAPLAARMPGTRLHAASDIGKATATGTATLGLDLPHAFCIPSARLTTELACAAFTLQDGNRFTTYVRLFPEPVETPP